MNFPNFANFIFAHILSIVLTILRYFSSMTFLCEMHIKEVRPISYLILPITEVIYIYYSMYFSECGRRGKRGPGGRSPLARKI